MFESGELAQLVGAEQPAEVEAPSPNGAAPPLQIET
jgi:hypothetical protein